MVEVMLMFCLLSGATPEFAVVTLGLEHIDCALGYQGTALSQGLALGSDIYICSLDDYLQELNMYLMKPNFPHVYIIEPIKLEALTT